VPGGLKRGNYKGIYTPGKKCDGCNYVDKQARRVRQRLTTAMNLSTIRVTTRRAAYPALERDLELDHDLQLYWPDGSCVEVSVTLRHDGFIELRSYTGRMQVLPLAGNAIAIRPEERHPVRKAKER
jgi:hypothetical protein